MNHEKAHDLLAGIHKLYSPTSTQAFYEILSNLTNDEFDTVMRAGYEIRKSKA